MVNYDFGAGEGQVPAGEHHFKITFAQEKTSRSGNPMIEIDCRVVGEKDYEPIRNWLVFTPKTEKVLRRELKALGFTIPPDNSPFKFNGTAQDFFGREFLGVVGEDDYNDETRMVIKSIKPLPGGTGPVATAAPAEIPF